MQRESSIFFFHFYISKEALSFWSGKLKTHSLHPINFMGWMIWKHLFGLLLLLLHCPPQHTQLAGVPCRGSLPCHKGLPVLCHPQGTDDRGPSDLGFVWDSRVQGLISRAKFTSYSLVIIVIIEQELFSESTKFTEAHWQISTLSEWLIFSSSIKC